MKNLNHGDKSFNLVIFGDIIAKLIIINCDEDRARTSPKMVRK